MTEVDLKRTEPETVAFIAMRGPFAQIPEAMGTLYGWAAQAGLRPAGMPSGWYPASIADIPEADVEWELHAPVAGDPAPVEPDASGLGVKRVEAHEVAWTMHTGPYETIGPVYEELLTWIDANGFKIVGPAEEVYFSEPETPPESCVTEVRIPIARR